MQRDMQLIRDLLLKIAAADKPPTFSDLVPGRRAEDPEYERAAYHMRMLIEEVGFVRGIDASSNSGADWLVLQLTWGGHDFIETLRDPTVWEKTKEGAKKLGGASFEIFTDLAKAYIRSEAKSRLGIDL